MADPEVRGGKAVPCDRCGAASAAHTCLQCGDALCLRCEAWHEVAEAVRRHTEEVLARRGWSPDKPLVFLLANDCQRTMLRHLAWEFSTPSEALAYLRSVSSEPVRSTFGSDAEYFGALLAHSL